MPGTSRCKDCGEEIQWLPTATGRVTPPMVLTQRLATILIDGIAHTGKAWEHHHCDPEKVRWHQSRLAAERDRKAASAKQRDDVRLEHEARVAALRERYADFIQTADAPALAREGYGTAVYALAMERVCPKCEAAAGEPCENLTKARAGKVVYTVNPHLERERLIPSHLHPLWLSPTEYVVPGQTPEGERDV